MGSFQQISLGIVCLVAAFLFGNYVNHYPDPGQVRNAVAEASSNQSLVSKDSVLEPGKTFQRAAQIDVMRGSQSAALPTMKLRNEPGTAETPLGAASDIGLPPPSDLAGDSKVLYSEDRPVTPAAEIPNLVEATKRREIVVPDFSQLAAQFQDTPLALPSLAANRSPVTGNSAPARTAPLDRDDTAVLDSVDQPEMTMEPFVTLQRKPESNAVHQAQAIGSEFTDDDFAPGLKPQYQPDRITSTNSQPSVPTTAPDMRSTGGEDQASNGNFVRSMQIDSSLPLRDQNRQVEPLGGRPTSNGLAMLAKRGDTGFENGSEPPAPRPAQVNQQRSKPMVPFGLNEQTRNNLVRLKTKKQAELTLGTERFDYYVTKNGDSLQSLSTKFYGRPDFYLDIYIANKHQLRNPVAIPAGMQLRIPLYE